MKKIWMVLGVAILSVQGAWAKPKQSQDQVYKKLQVFSKVLQYIESNYIEDVDAEKLLDDALKGLTSNLDPHTSYLPPEYYREMKVDTSGKFGGVGIEIGVNEKREVVIIAPTEDGPAEKAGVKAGDMIVEIEGKSALDLNLMEVVKLIRGKAGTELRMKLRHMDQEDPYEVTLKRKTIKLKSVASREYDNIGYIQVKGFQEKTDEEVRKAFEKMDGKDQKLRGLILDLRNNPGGLLTQAQDVSDLFLSEGAIVSTKGKDGAFEEVLTAQKEGTLRFVPMIILINEGTASAAEIVAGALQDHKRAVLLGTPSFGKGSVQTIIDLEDGSGLKLTVARYYTPLGKAIQGVGDQPDVYVSANAPQESENTVPIREKDLEGRLKSLSPNGKESHEDARKNDATSNSDLQLERALEYLRSWDIFQRPFSSQLEKKVS
ncbi:MAG: S41 family peptidase [Bdellovibrionota bacterium]